MAPSYTDFFVPVATCLSKKGETAMGFGLISSVVVIFQSSVSHHSLSQ